MSMVDFYQIRSPLSQITEERMHRFVNALSDWLIASNFSEKALMEDRKSVV